MANGSGPSPSGLIILTGMTIAAVVGLYAYDAIPRRGGVAPSVDIAWPRWQTENPTALSVQTQGPQPPAYTTQNRPSQPPQFPQDPRGQDLPEDQQNARGGAGLPPPPDGGQGE